MQKKKLTLLTFIFSRRASISAGRLEFLIWRPLVSRGSVILQRSIWCSTVQFNSDTNSQLFSLKVQFHKTAPTLGTHCKFQPGGMHLLIQFSSVQSCPTLCDPMNHTTPGLPVHHQLLEFTQTHMHQVGNAIQPSHPLSSPSPPAPNPSQHQSLFQWVNSSHQVAKVLEFQL